VENQERELRRWAERLGFDVVRVCAETASGARSNRAALAEVPVGAHRREFDVILIWSLDRFSREGILPMVRYFEQLSLASVRGGPPRNWVHRVPRFELGCGPTTPGRPGHGRTGG
jgi:DNA invertase Pin-like site-specific DNA recombinase